MWLQFFSCPLFGSAWEPFCSRSHFLKSSWTVRNPYLACSGSGSDLHYLDQFRKSLIDWVDWRIDGRKAGGVFLRGGTRRDLTARLLKVWNAVKHLSIYYFKRRRKNQALDKLDESKWDHVYVPPDAMAPPRSPSPHPPPVGKSESGPKPCRASRTRRKNLFGEQVAGTRNSLSHVIL